MKITLTQELDVAQGICYMRLREWQKREDIVDFLHGTRTGKKALDDGITRYLRTIGVYSYNGQLSPEGEELLETGLYPTLSEGKYFVWFAYDPILGDNRILYYEREPTTTKNDALDPRYAQAISILEIERAGTKDTPRLRVELETLDLPIVLQDHRVQIDMIHTYDTDAAQGKQARRYYIGTLSRDAEKKYGLQYTEDAAIEDKQSFWDEWWLPEIGRMLSGKWEQKYNRLAIGFAEAYALLEGDKNALQRFNLVVHTLNPNQEQKIKIEHMGLMPSNEREATQWFEYLLLCEAKRSYLQQSDLESIAALREAEALEIYRAKLSTQPVAELAMKCNKEDRVSYWHLMAAEDLNPHNELQIAAPFTLEANSSYTMTEIVTRLGIEPSARWVAYYDNYVRKAHQQSYIGIFLNAIAAEHSIVITEKEEMETTASGKNYLEKHTKAIILDKEAILKKGRDFHDRYLILCDTHGEVHLWALSNGLSDFDKGGRDWKELDTSTQLLSKQTLTITPIETRFQQQLIDDLQKYHVKNPNLPQAGTDRP